MGTSRYGPLLSCMQQLSMTDIEGLTEGVLLHGRAAYDAVTFASCSCTAFAAWHWLLLRQLSVVMVFLFAW